MALDDPTLDPISIAEDYRRQRQASDAKKAGVDPAGKAHFIGWLEENEERLLQVVRGNGFDDGQAREIFDDYREKMQAAPEGSAYDNPSLQYILSSLFSEIEDLCRANEVPVGDGVVVGSIPKIGIEAYQMPVLTTKASIIAISGPLIMLCNGVSKLIAETVVLVAEGDRFKAIFDPAKVLDNLRSQPDLLRRWFYLIGDYGTYGVPPVDGSSWTVPLDKLQLRVHLLYAMEWFVMAHEYGHHVADHARSGSSEESEGNKAQELEADVFARGVSMRLGAERTPQNFFAMAGVGAVVILASLELIGRARSVLDTGKVSSASSETHPPFIERLKAMEVLDETAPIDMRSAFADVRVCFLEIIEGLWSILQPGYLRLHADGLRSQLVEHDFDRSMKRLSSPPTVPPGSPPTASRPAR